MSEFLERINEMMRGSVSAQQSAAAPQAAAPEQDISSRLVEKLTAKRGAGLEGLGGALASAFGYAPEFQAIQEKRDTREMEKEKLLYQLLKEERDYGLKKEETQRKVTTEREKSVLDWLKFGAERNDKNAKAVLDTIKQFTPSEDDQHIVANELAQLKEAVDAGSAGTIIPRVVQQLVTEKRIKATKSTAGTSEFERHISNLLASGQITQEQADGLRQERAQVTAQGGQGVRERENRRMNELALAAQGRQLSAAEQQELNNLVFQATRRMAVPDQGIYGFSPPLPGAPAAQGQSVPGGGAVPTPGGGAVGQPSQATGGGGVPQPGTTGAPALVIPAMPKILPPEARKLLSGAYKSEKALADLEKGLKYTGRLRGQLSRAQVAVGENDAAILFDTAVKNLRVLAQDVIEGIPSNFDVETFIKTLPSFGQPETVNRSRLEFTKHSTKQMVETTISYYKGLNYQIPDFALKMARRMGIDPNTLQPISENEATERFDQLQVKMEQFLSGGPEDKPSAGSERRYNPRTKKMEPVE